MDVIDIIYITVMALSIFIVWLSIAFVVEFFCCNTTEHNDDIEMEHYREDDEDVSMVENVEPSP